MGCGCGKKKGPGVDNTSDALKKTLTTQMLRANKNEPINIVAPVNRKTGQVTNPRVVSKAQFDKFQAQQKQREAIERNKNPHIKPPTTPPSLLKRAFNFAKATKEYVSSGMHDVSKEMYAKRLTICKRCPIFNAKTSTCTKCGCFMTVKAKWATSTCPDTPSRWPEVKISKDGNNKKNTKG
tara:strand:+ start:12205 stop:12747 length:543 start_codon:yes stop_codon:yes gene_type:complete